MGERYGATLTLWPANSLPASVAAELRQAGIDIEDLNVQDGSATLYCTSEGQVALELSFEDSYYGIAGLEAILAELRLANISYYAWDEGFDECPPTGRCFDRHRAGESEFAVLPDGSPVLTLSDLDPLEHYGSAEAVVAHLRERMRRPTPEFTVAICQDHEASATAGGDRS